MKLAIATDKPGTTRGNLLGIAQDRKTKTQIAFLDTPGFEESKDVLGRAIYEEAKASIDQVDAVLLLVEAKPLLVRMALSKADKDIIKTVRRMRKDLPIILVFSKVDLVKDKPKLLPVLEQISKDEKDISAIVPCSAKTKGNIAAIVTAIKPFLTEGKSYDNDTVTDKPTRYLVAEFVREAAMRGTYQELPYSVAVQIETFKEEPRLVRIQAVIIVDRESHKSILIGKKGTMLKTIGTESRLAMEELLEKKVFLTLFVRVEENWTQNSRKVKEYNS